MIQSQVELQYTHNHLGASRRSHCPAGFVANQFVGELGKGEECFHAAKRLLIKLQMLNVGWLNVVYEPDEIVQGSHVATLIRTLGVYWLNVARVVFVGDESPTRFSFVYGTLPAYTVSGEERFSVVYDTETGRVDFEIYSFSRSATWLAKLGWPLVRRMQRQFCHDSLATLKAKLNA